MKEGIQRQAVSQSESESELRVLRRTKLKLVHCKFALLLAFRVRDGACVCPFFVGFCWICTQRECSQLFAPASLPSTFYQYFRSLLKKNYIYKKTTVVHYTRIHISNARSKRLFAHPGGRVVPTFFYGRVPP